MLKGGNPGQIGMVLSSYFGWNSEKMSVADAKTGVWILGYEA